MAVKDHTLDARIVHSAVQEFLRFGYQKASINRIAANAGVTTGAIYTRYKNKDALFSALVQEPLEEMRKRGRGLCAMYYAVHGKEDLDKFLDAVQSEMHICLEVLFLFPEQCVLLFCRSAGSSVETAVQQMLKGKEQSTVAFLEQLSGKDMAGAGLLIRMQFQLFDMILESGMDQERALAAFALVEHFVRAGWKDLFENSM